MEKSKYSRVQLEETLDSVSEIAKDLNIVVDTYVTKTELANSIPKIAFNDVCEITDITPY